MGNIPEFTRTVLPQNAQYGLADARQAAGRAEANQLRYDAEITRSNRQLGNQMSHDLNMVRLREAEAENTTWVNENAIQYKKDITDRLEQARQARNGNPNNFHKDFDKELDNLARDYAKKAPSEAARMAIKDTTNRIRSSYYDDNLSWEKSRKVSMFGESMERSASNLAIMAYRAGQDGKTLEETGVMNDVDASVVAGSTFVAGDKLGGMKDSMSRTVVSSYMQGLVEKNPAKARELLNSRQYDKVLGVDQLQGFESKLKAQERIEAGDDLSDIEQAAKLGIEVPQDKIQSTIAKLESAGMQEQASGLREFGEIQTSVVEFAKKPLTAQREELKTMKATIEGGDLSNVKKYAAMADVLQTKQEAIQKDPWSYYSARDVVSDPETLDFSNPQNMAVEMERRRVAVQQVQDLDGVTMPMFTSDEIDALKKVYETAQPDEISALMATMGNSLKPSEQSALAQAMAPKSAELAVAIAVDDPQVGEKIIIGSQIDGLVTKNDVSAEVLGKLEGVITDPVRMNKVQDAIYSYYKVLQFQAKDKNAAVNGDYIDQAIEDIMGPVVNIDTRTGWGGTSKVLSYKDNSTGVYVDSDALQDTLKALTDDRIKLLNGGALPVGTSGAKFTAADIYKTGRFVSDGDGMYAIIDEQGEPIGNEDGSIFRVDARKLEQMVKGGK